MLFPVTSLSTNRQSQHIVDRVAIVARNTVSAPLTTRLLSTNNNAQYITLNDSNSTARIRVLQGSNTIEFFTSTGASAGAIYNSGQSLALSGADYANGRATLILGSASWSLDSVQGNGILSGASNSALAWSTGYAIVASFAPLNGDSYLRSRLGIGTTTPSAQLHASQVASTSGSPCAFLVTGGAHTTLAASTESPDINFNLARTVQFATGAITTQRAIRVQPPTYSFVGASTITTAVTLDIGGAPVAGTNATITMSLGLRVAGGALIGTSMNDMIGHWGSTPVVQQVLATGASKTVDDVITLLQTLGLCKQS